MKYKIWNENFVLPHIGISEHPLAKMLPLKERHTLKDVYTATQLSFPESNSKLTRRWKGKVEVIYDGRGDLFMQYNHGLVLATQRGMPEWGPNAQLATCPANQMGNKRWSKYSKCPNFPLSYYLPFVVLRPNLIATFK